MTDTTATVDLLDSTRCSPMRSGRSATSPASGSATDPARGRGLVRAGRVPRARAREGARRARVARDAPEGYGVRGRRGAAYGLACLELEAGDSGLRSFVSVQGSLAMYAIHAFGSEEQKQSGCRGWPPGEAIGCFGLTEPDSGSDPARCGPRARRDGDDWVLNGHARCGSPTAASPTSRSCGRRPTTASAGSSSRRDTPGFSAPDITHKLSLRASVTVRARPRRRAAARRRGAARGDGLEGPAVVPDRGALRDRLGRHGRGARLLRVRARLREDAGPVRPADRRRSSSRRRSSPTWRSSWTRARCSPPLRPAEGRGQARARARQRRQAQQHRGRRSRSRATARAILGANGITLEYPIMRHMTNLESVLTYEGTEEIHTLVSASPHRAAGVHVGSPDARRGPRPPLAGVTARRRRAGARRRGRRARLGLGVRDLGLRCGRARGVDRGRHDLDRRRDRHPADGRIERRRRRRWPRSRSTT